MAWHTARIIDLISEPLHFSDIRPDRRALRWLARHYHLLTRLASGAIVMAVTIPDHWPLGVSAVLGYMGVVVGLNLLEQRRPGLVSGSRQKFLRTIVLIAGITVFICAMRALRATDAATTTQPDLLWLLYVLAVFILSLDGGRPQVEIAVALSAGGLLIANLISFEAGSALWITLVEAAWLALLSFILYALVRLLMDRAWDQVLLQKIQVQISRSIDSLDDQAFLDEVVKSISAHCGYEHVNFFWREADGSLICKAASSENGRSLIREGLRLRPHHGHESNQGIIPYVMATGRPYFTNRAARDRHYLPHPAFPTTRAELAVPVSMSGETIGVLDVQDDQSDVFSEQDVAVLQLIAQLVSDVYRQLGWRRMYHRLERLAYSMTAGMLSHRDLDEMLKEIARIALDEFKADIVAVLARNPRTGEIERRVQDGQLRAPNHPDSAQRGFHMAQRLMAERDSYYFHSDVSQYRDHPIFGAGDREEEGQPGFVEREGIRSRVICCLGPAASRVGVMFLNFREPRRFKSEEEQAPFFLFAHLAATAIQNAQTQEQEILLERERLHALLHDQAKNSLYYAHQTLLKVLDSHKLCDADRESLQHIKRNIADTRRTIAYLTRTGQMDGPRGAPASLQAVVNEVVDNARTAFRVEFASQWSGELPQIAPDTLVNIRLVMEEAVANAIMHGQARRIDVDVAYHGQTLRIDIRDNGCGFDPHSVREHGLAHMRHRVGRLRGRLEIDSRPGHGARIHVELPLTSQGV